MSSTKAFSPPSGGRGVRLKPNQFLLPSGILITEHPILFQTELVRANLEDRKTQTRRTRGLKEIPDFKFDRLEFSERFGPYTCLFEVKIERNPDRYQIKYMARSPYGKPGDLLWVKETWGLNKVGVLGFRADKHIPHSLVERKWKPSIHMRKKYSRIWAMVEDIRVERVQDISEEDAIAEGIGELTKDQLRVFRAPGSRQLNKVFARNRFQHLWISINGEESWNSNPWVWVIRYRILSKTGRPSMETIAAAYEDVVNRKSSMVNQEGGSHA